MTTVEEYTAGDLAALYEYELTRWESVNGGVPVSKDMVRRTVQVLRELTAFNERLRHEVRQLTETVRGPDTDGDDFYTDERHCGHCEKDTQQRCRDSKHERDSSADFQECLECGWIYTGYSGDWTPPNFPE